MKLRLVMNEGEDAFTYDVEGTVISVGRSNANDIQIHDRRVSRNHLVLRPEGTRYYLKDLGSGNGTYVNGYRIPSGSTVEVKEGFVVTIGRSVFCIGEGSSGDLFAFLDSFNPSKRRGNDTTTVIADEDNVMAA